DDPTDRPVASTGSKPASRTESYLATTIRAGHPQIRTPDDHSSAWCGCPRGTSRPCSALLVGRCVLGVAEIPRRWVLLRGDAPIRRISDDLGAEYRRPGQPLQLR